MSQVMPQAHREPVEIAVRRGLSAKARQAILDRQGPSCAVQGCARPWIEADHVLPLALGGADILENLEGLCKACHVIKTRADVKAIAKANRIIARRNGTRRRRKPIAQPASPWPKGKTRWGKRGFG